MKQLADVHETMDDIARLIDKAIWETADIDRVLKATSDGTIGPAARMRLLVFIASLKALSDEACALTMYLE